MNAPASIPAGEGAAMLRAATRAAHDAVDAAFGGFGLVDAPGYTRFLLAHALALPAAEASLRALPFFATLEPRTPLLADDLAVMGQAMPVPLAFEAGDDAALWGVLYVVEGSRLGGVMLAREVPTDRPRAYLAAAHPPGGWRTIRQRIDEAADEGDAAWRQRMTAGALACFDLYARAAVTLASREFPDSL